MRILLTNDDGIRAPGIIALYNALVDAANQHGGPLLGASVEVVAPLTVQSATSHGVTFDQPIMTTEVRVGATTTTPAHFTGTAVDGRPADCVKLALTNLWPKRHGPGTTPDLVISGMNAGANCGINTIYSGTVAAALEAAFLGVPSIAVSLQLGRGQPDFDTAAWFARRTLERLLAGGLPNRHECLSINIPTTEVGSRPDMPQIVVCPMNTHGLVDSYEERTSPRGEAYFWSTGHGLNFRDTIPGTDVEHLLKHRRITVTPLSFDLTRHDRLGPWAERIGK